VKPLRAKSGRPNKLSKLSADDRAKLLKLLRAGTPKSWACRAIGVSRQTFENYRAEAEKGREPFMTFIRDAEQAQAGFVVDCLRVLTADAVGAPLTAGRERGNGDVKWILERLFPKDFALTTKNEVTGKDGAPFDQPRACVVILPPKDPE
jgi:hypothetical protein